VRVGDPIRIAYATFCTKLGTRGLSRGAGEGPLAYAARVSRARPDLAALVQRFIALYVRLRYASEVDPGRVGELQALARQFKP